MEEQKTASAPIAAEGDKKASGGMKFIWDFFTSVKLTVFLLIILALVSIIGTVIDQTDPGKNMKFLVGLFGPAGAPGALHWLETLGLTNMYHSWWFVTLLSTLCVNITVCSLERLPGVMKVLSRPIEPLTDDSMKSIPLRREVRVKGDLQGMKDKAREAVAAMGFTPTEAALEGGEVQFYAEKGKYTRLGVYITHASILIIFIGALIGSFWGYKGYVQIMENNMVSEIGLTNKPLLKSGMGDTLPIPFKVRCDKFELKLYEGSGMPSDYLSTLTVLDAGQEVKKKTIRVNDPLEYKGIRFFQSSYGVSPQMATMTLRAYPKDGSVNIRDYSLRRNERVRLEGTPYDMVLTDMAPDVVIGPNQQLIAQSDQFNGRGVAMLSFLDSHGHAVEQATIISEVPQNQPQGVPYNFEIRGYHGPYYTGLQVTHDPGVWVVYLGCITLVLGILVAFFLSHRRVWVRLRPEKGQVAVIAAGSANKNKYTFETEFKRMFEKLGPKQA